MTQNGASQIPENVLKCAYTRITDDLRQALLKCIDSTKKARTFGSVFAEPVDYVALGIPDYIEVIKRPMDLSTLKSNLLVGEYIFLHEFLKDAELIFSNCRTYNGMSNDGYFWKAAEEVEKFFINTISRIDGLNLTLDIYKKIVQSPIPVIPEYSELPMTVSELQIMIKRMSELPKPALTTCIQYYLQRKGASAEEMAGKEFTLHFVSTDSAILRDLDKLIRKKAMEAKENKTQRAKKLKH